MAARVLAFALTLSAPALAATTDEAAIRAFVEGVNEASMSFFSSGSEEDARARCRSLLASSFDLPPMAEYALGRVWKKATDKQRKELLAAFEEEAITAYLGRMRPPGAKLEYVGQRPPVEGHPLAASRHIVPGKPDETWIWELRPEGKSWRIVDLYVDGHSALSTERQEYGSVFDANKGDVDAVIAFMRDRASKPTENK